MKTVALVIGAFIAIVGISVGLMYLFGFISMGTAEFRGNVGVVEDTRANSAFRIQAYERFFNLCAEVQSLESRIALLDNGVPLSDKESKERRGLQGIRASRIAQYNNDARKDYTVGQFRDSGLPYQLRMNGGNSCVGF